MNMTSKERKARIKPGAVFMIGGAMYRVINVEGDYATVKDVKTGKTAHYGVDALSRFNITFIDA